ncbi:EVE domain-containing protein [Paenibacillus albidus]|uniref:EVE domain-containing protein n=1 Tax=Paenibacillus albidus TaxID=2041023 RepID=UPI001BE722D8|nr:EVE domain-containing protein [Paenibacillus albidus]MBT2291341.1 EVE domain-containing protein [Paenibacillus albidus]
MQLNEIDQQSRFWIGVVSASHVKSGELGGFAQLCHGKSEPLRKMRAGDWLIYYSPRTDMTKGAPLQAFTAIGEVADGQVYRYQMSESFVPFRRNISYLSCREVQIRDLLEQLSFTRGNTNWGYSFRYGHFEIGREDFLTIASAMLSAVNHTISRGKFSVKT